MNAKGLFLAILVAFCNSTFAQAPLARLSGQITDPAGQPVFNALVHLKGTTNGAVTDESGHYQIAKAKPGRYTLVFSHINYERDSIAVSLAAGADMEVDRQLVDKISSLDEIEIVGKSASQEIREKPFHVNVIDVRSLQQKNIDLNKILTQASGVRVRQNAGLGSSFDLTLNGFKAAQFINGIPVEVYGSAYAFNSIPVNQIERIEVFKGVVPVHLGGDALGGAVNIVTRDRPVNNLNVAYSAGSFNTHKASVQGVFRSPSTGFTVFGATFFNASDNNYVMKDMEIVSGATSYKKDVRRFHDDFLSYAAKAEAGYTNVKFADVLLVGAGFSGIRRDIQTGSSQYPPIGDAKGEEDNVQFSLRYAKHSLLNSKLDLDGFLLYSRTNTVFVDTSSRTYQWDGSVLVQRPSTSHTGEFENKQIYRTLQHDLSQRYNVSYHLDDHNALTLNAISNNTRWQNTDPGKIEGTTVDDNVNTYSKLIVGAGHNLKLWNDRFQSTAFIKYYHMKAETDSASSWRGGYFVREPLSTTKSFTGAGVGVSYALSERLSTKASVEYASRLPSVYELLGDGISTVANVSLKPEVSMNYNLGFSLMILNQGSLTLSLDGAGFYRKAENFIRVTTGVRRATYINFDAALVRGVESELKLGIANKMSLRLNGSYQQVLDDNKYIGGKLPNYSYREQLPNTPSLFGNADAEYKFTGLFNDRLTITPYYSLLYVKEFYLGYANIARGDLKYTIPMQLVHDIGMTFSGPAERYSVSVECANFTDALAFDNFRLQKAGRAVNFKITYNLN